LPFECPSPILALGGQLKNTFALGCGRRALLSHHAGDLDELLAFEAFERDVDLYERTFHITPRAIAHDLHPDYASTQYARRRIGVTHIGVQHHHAHLAGCMAEHGLEGPVIGVAWDGAGWGLDGCVWGGEFLIGDRFAVQRAAHFRYVAQPGGDRAAREPWRMALSHLLDTGVDDRHVFEGIPQSVMRTVIQMIARGVNAPLSSSAGWLFDAVAALCGAATAMTFEGQAAMWLESLAEESGDRARYSFALSEPAEPDAPLVVDTRPLIRAIAEDCRRGVAPAAIARRFHATLGAVVRDVADLMRARTGLNRVALSGGVFLNAILTAEVETQLVESRFEVYRHQLVPPGDGGLSLGQIAVAAARIAAEET
jgi:hydrogenase maturation protein HypF